MSAAAPRPGLRRAPFVAIAAACLASAACTSMGGARGGDPEPKTSHVLRLVLAGRLDEAADVLKTPSAEDQLAILLAGARIAIVAGDYDEAAAKLDAGAERVRSLDGPPNAEWERSGAWTAARLELRLVRDPLTPLTEGDVAALEAIVADSTEPARSRFEAQKVLYRDSFLAGRLASARTHLLALIGLADRLSWGITSQGAQALALASEYYAAVGEVERSLGFAVQAFEIHARAGAARNYYAVLAQVVGAEALIAAIESTRREEADDTRSTSVQLEELEKLLGFADRALAGLDVVSPELDLRIGLVKARAQLLPNLPWLGPVIASIGDGPWRVEGAVAQQHLRAIASAAAKLGDVRRQAEALRLLALAQSAAGEKELAARTAAEALSTARLGYPKSDFRLLAFINGARLAMLELPRTPDRTRDYGRLTVESVALIDRSFRDYFVGSTFREKTSFATSPAVQWAMGLLTVNGTGADPSEEYEALLKVKGRVHRALRAEFGEYRRMAAAGDAGAGEIGPWTSAAGDFVYDWDDGTLGGLSIDQRIFPWLRLAELSSRWRAVSRAASAREAGTNGPSRTELERIQGAMRDDEVLVDLVRVDLPGLADVLIAYVLGPAGPPVRVEVGSTDWVGRLALTLRAGMLEADTDSAQQEFDETSEYFRLHHWSGIEAAIDRVNPDAATMYLVPTRELGAVPISALKSGRGSYLGEELIISHLFTAHDLIPARHADARASGMLLVGNVDYGARDVWAMRGTFAAEHSVAPLLRSEFDAVADLYSRHPEIGETTPLSASAAGERAFREAAGRHRIVHMQTHGFSVDVSPLAEYLEGSSGNLVNSRTLTPNAEVPPLLGYGLALTGANMRDDGSPGGARGRDNGIATAAEIALMDLSATELVVLSACDAAIGEFISNEMMLGLAAGFDYAGARSIVGTVSPVNDAATSRLMKAFHEALLTGLTPGRALQVATKSLRGQSIDGIPLDRPRYWAPFVVFGPQRSAPASAGR